MTNKPITFLLSLSLVLSSVLVTAADTRRARKVAPAGLVALLPASDAVVTFESDRFFSQALPQLLSGNQKLFSEMMVKVDEIRQTTGIDLRQFDEVVVGVSATGPSPDKIDYQPLILARGKFSSDSLVAIVKIAGSGKYREEQVGNRTIYVFSPSEVAAKNKPSGTSTMDNILTKVIENLDREMALTAYDDGTLAVGTVARVKDVLGGASKLDAEMLSAVGKKPAALMSAAMRTPQGMEQFLKLDNDSLGTNLKSIRMLSMDLDVANSNASLSLSAKMTTVEQATDMKQMLDGFKSFLPALLGGGRGNNKIFGRIAENARITRVGSNVSLSVSIPQSDINVLIGD